MDQENETRAPSRRVLIVDDEEDIRESLKDLLEGSGAQIECRAGANGEEGLDLLETERFDLVISDFKMPGMDGIEFLTRAGRIAAHTPRILITAFPDLQVAVRAINDAGIENFFTKPLDPDEIVRVVTETLDARDLEVQRERALARALQATRPAEASAGGGNDA